MRPQNRHKLVDTSSQRLYHYYLVAGEVMLEKRDNPELQSSVHLNAVLQSETQALDTRQIAKAQRMLQALLASKVGEEGMKEIKITDVFILGISHLGRMTKEQFETPPEETRPVALPGLPVPTPKLV